MYQAPPVEQHEPTKKRDKKQQQETLDLLTFYRVAKRSLALELDPVALRFRGQITFDLELRGKAESPSSGAAAPPQQILEHYKAQEKKRLHLEAKFLAKQVQVVGIYLLKEAPDELKKEDGDTESKARDRCTRLKFAEGSLQDPED